MYRTKRMKCKNGFTLLELLISCFILVFASASILLMFITSTFLLDDSRHATVALNDAQTVLEEIRRVANASLSNVVSTDWQNWAAGNGLNTLNEENIQVTFADSSSDPLEVNVSVNWNEKTRARALKLKQIITQR